MLNYHLRAACDIIFSSILTLVVSVTCAFMRNSTMRDLELCVTLVVSVTCALMRNSSGECDLCIHA